MMFEGSFPVNTGSKKKGCKIVRTSYQIGVPDDKQKYPIPYVITSQVIDTIHIHIHTHIDTYNVSSSRNEPTNEHKIIQITNEKENLAIT